MTGDDWERLGVDAERLAHFIGNQAFMKIEGHHCAALERASASSFGAPREARQERGAFWCSVYEKRPQICRELARGSGECAGEIETKRRLTLLP